jgi:hypothetical protein
VDHAKELSEKIYDAIKDRIINKHDIDKEEVFDFLKQDHNDTITDVDNYVFDYFSKYDEKAYSVFEKQVLDLPSLIRKRIDDNIIYDEEKIQRYFEILKLGLLLNYDKKITSDNIMNLSFDPIGLLAYVYSFIIDIIFHDKNVNDDFKSEFKKVSNFSIEYTEILKIYDQIDHNSEYLVKFWNRVSNSLLYDLFDDSYKDLEIFIQNGSIVDKLHKYVNKDFEYFEKIKFLYVRRKHTYKQYKQSKTSMSFRDFCLKEGWGMSIIDKQILSFDILNDFKRIAKKIITNLSENKVYISENPRLKKIQYDFEVRDTLLSDLEEYQKFDFGKFFRINYSLFNDIYSIWKKVYNIESMQDKERSLFNSIAEYFKENFKTPQFELTCYVFTYIYTPEIYQENKIKITTFCYYHKNNDLVHEYIIAHNFKFDDKIFNYDKDNPFDLLQIPEDDDNESKHSKVEKNSSNNDEIPDLDDLDLDDLID